MNRSTGLTCAVAGLIAMLAIGSSHAQVQPATPRPIVIVALGDSLTAGFQLPPAAAFPAQLEAKLRGRGHDVTVVNSGVSGDTTGAGLERLAWAIPDGADAAIVQLGANDALRGLPPANAKANLGAIIGGLKSRGMDVLLAGMLAPRNWGQDYATAFDSMYTDLAKQYGVALYPFFLDGVALKPELNMADGLHPTAAGIAVVVDRVLPDVEALIAAVKVRRLATAKG